jgi:hypothetical protein
LVHARNVLTHVSSWEVALEHMIDALRPGGWLLVEEPDWAIAGTSHPPSDAAETFWRGVAQLVRAKGGDPSLGRRLPHALVEAGLTGVGAEGRTMAFFGDSILVQLDTLGVVLVGAGLMSADDLDRLRLRWRRGAASPTLRFS